MKEIMIFSGELLIGPVRLEKHSTLTNNALVLVGKEYVSTIDFSNTKLKYKRTGKYWNVYDLIRK